MIQERQDINDLVVLKKIFGSNGSGSGSGYIRFYFTVPVPIPDLRN